jgi:hypothetical protein
MNAELSAEFGNGLLSGKVLKTNLGLEGWA